MTTPAPEPVPFDPNEAANPATLRRQLTLWEEKLAQKQASHEVLKEDDMARSCLLQRTVLQDTIGVLDAYAKAHAEFKELIPLVWQAVDLKGGSFKEKVVRMKVLQWFDKLCIYAKQRREARRAATATPTQTA